MKTKLHCIFILSFLGFSFTSVAQEKKIVKAKLNEVTVFFQGGELSHTATSALTKGENEIYIEGLSPNIDINSLKIKASNGVIVSAFEFSIDFLSEYKPTNTITRKLQDSIDMYQQKIGVLQTDIKINQQLIALLQKGTDKNVSGSDKGLGIEELVKNMEYYKTKSAELESIQVANTKKKRELDKSISRLEKQINQESTKNSKTSGILKLSLASPTINSCTFTVSYYTAAANWVPYYDINITSTDKPIKIIAKSKVRQTTGLDWEKVKLTLSTTSPSTGKIAPLFSTWFLNYVYQISDDDKMVQNAYSYLKEEDQQLEEVVVMAASKTSNQKSASAIKIQTPIYVVDGEIEDEEYVNSLDPSMIKSRTQLDKTTSQYMYGATGSAGAIVITLKSGMDDYITQTTNDLNMVYDIDIPYTIPGNGKEQSIELQTKETPAEYKYYATPKLDTETFLLAEIANWEKLSLLSGKANITYDGTYIGESYIDANSTLDKLALTLGTDKRVAVKREKMQDMSSTKFLGSDTKQVFTYKITVKNNQNKTVKMVLKDQYPLSNQKNITVELLVKETTPWTANKEDVGVITWEEDLKAGETKVYQISYSVKYPKDSKLNL